MKIYAARQPVFDSTGKLFGYEFLYRDSDRNEFNMEIDGSMATCLLLSNMLSEFGLENLTGGVYAFVNLTQELLRNEYISIMDPKHFIIEILEDINDDSNLESTLAAFREKGYVFAMDDYTGEDNKDRLISVSDILKVDFRLTDKKVQTTIAQKYKDSKILLAEKIETEEEQKWAVDNGYSLLQGYYYSKPVLLYKEKTEIALTTYMRLLKEFSKPDTDFTKLAEIIMMDVNLSYKFLMRVNTLQYGGKYRVKTVKQSLVRMGLIEVRRWTLAILLSDVFGKKDNETAKRALIRGVFAEKLVSLMKRGDLQEEAYLVGMFSTIDITVRDNLESLLKQIKVSDESREALFFRSGILGEVLNFVEDYETGRWDKLNEFMRKNKLKQSKISYVYFEAVKYAEIMFEEYGRGGIGDYGSFMQNKSPLIEMLNKQRSREMKEGEADK